MNRIFGNLGDRLNPIVVKEVRQAVNSRIVSSALLLFLAVQMIVVGFQVSFSSDTRGESAVDLRAGRQIFGIVQGILVGTCILIIPAFTGVRLAGERSDVNVDLLFITSLTPWKIISGKFVAAGALALLIFSAAAPFMTFAYVLRGLDVPTILLILLADFLAVLLGTIFTIFLAAIPATRGFRILLGLFALSGLGYLIAGTVLLSVGLLQFEVLIDYSSTEFWLGLAGSALLVVGAIGLYFVWSVAMISPPSANRALPVRLYTLGLWLSLGVAAAVASRYSKQAEPMLIWLAISASLFSLQFLIAVCERSEWGPRITRRIPENMLRRTPAFFFYSGSAGGIAFGLVNSLLSLLTVWIWRCLNTDLHWPFRWDESVILSALTLGYAYCYSMTAVLVRRFGKGRGLDPTITWLVTLILVGLGSVLPFILGEMFIQRTSRLLRDDTFFPLFLTNPFLTIGQVAARSSFSEMAGVFLGAWAIVVTLLNLSWLAEQVRAFKPSARPAVRPRKVDEPILLELAE